MKFLSQKLKKPSIAVMLLLIVGGVGYGIYYYKYGKATVTATYAVVEKIGQGTVSSGIVASGKIVAAHKLDLNVYKQAQRIEAVNVVNGGHVAQGATILSFDKSSSYVNVESSRVALTEKQLALQNQQENSTDPNATIRTRQKEIADLKTSITQAEQDTVIAYRDFLNADLEAQSYDNRTLGKTRPTVSGLYGGTVAGTYKIDVYSSAAASRYSYQVSGLETDIKSVLLGTATKIGTKGLEIVFPSNVSSGDTWTVTLPNTDSPNYIKNKEKYDTTVRHLSEAIAGYKIDIANKEQELKNLQQTDGSANRNLDVSKAQAQLQEARVQLSQNYNVVKEQDIVAPFSGTIEGLENVVVGAIPTRSTNDPIVLGTLISDDFLANFTLGAVDITKVTVGQKVLVTITSFPNSDPLEAHITAISSLPDATGVAQYAVQALITPPASSTLALREGLVADVVIVQQEKQNVTRIPLSAVTFANKKATVQIISDLTASQKAQIEKLGVLRSDTGVFPSYPKEVTLGVTGAFYAEILSGVEVGTTIIVSKTEKTETAVVQQKGFGPGRPHDEQSNTKSSAAGTKTATGNSAPQ